MEFSVTDDRREHRYCLFGLFVFTVSTMFLRSCAKPCIFIKISSPISRSPCKIDLPSFANNLVQ